MNVLLDARTAIPRFPGIGRYADELAAALSGVFVKSGDRVLDIHIFKRERDR